MKKILLMGWPLFLAMKVFGGEVDTKSATILEESLEELACSVTPRPATSYDQEEIVLFPISSSVFQQSKLGGLIVSDIPWSWKFETYFSKDSAPNFDESGSNVSISSNGGGFEFTAQVQNGFGQLQVNVDHKRFSYDNIGSNNCKVRPFSYSSALSLTNLRFRHLQPERCGNCSFSETEFSMICNTGTPSNPQRFSLSPLSPEVIGEIGGTMMGVTQKAIYVPSSPRDPEADPRPEFWRNGSSDFMELDLEKSKLSSSYSEIVIVAKDGRTWKFTRKEGITNQFETTSPGLSNCELRSEPPGFTITSLAKHLVLSGQAGPKQ